jgi:beta-phosphoglucomutase
MTVGRPYEAILFDFDGVLVDSEPIHFDCWREVLAPFGIDLDWPTYHRTFIGVSDRTMLNALAPLARRPVTAGQLYHLYPAKKELFRARILVQPPLSHGLMELLSELAGFRLAVVTSSGRAEVKPVLEACGIEPFLSAAVFGDDVQSHKPAPEPYQRAAALLGVERALVVEDSDAGVASGRAAGFDVLRIPEPHRMVELVRQHLLL